MAANIHSPEEEAKKMKTVMMNTHKKESKSTGNDVKKTKQHTVSIKTSEEDKGKEGLDITLNELKVEKRKDVTSNELL
jgi:hypothetical protein